jgi:hypothetical protein
MRRPNTPATNPAMPRPGNPSLHDVEEISQEQQASVNEYCLAFAAIP